MGETLYYETEHTNHKYCNNRGRFYHRPDWGQFIHNKRKRNGARQYADADWRNFVCHWAFGSGCRHPLVSGQFYRRQVEEKLGKVTLQMMYPLQIKPKKKDFANPFFLSTQPYLYLGNG
jgi:hypothetical protein